MATLLGKNTGQLPQFRVLQYYAEILRYYVYLNPVTVLSSTRKDRVIQPFWVTAVLRLPLSI